MPLELSAGRSLLNRAVTPRGRMPKLEAAGSTGLDAALLPVPAPSTPTFGAYAPSQQRSRQLYQEWPGNNRFCFNGHIMMGPWSDWPCVPPPPY